MLVASRRTADEQRLNYGGGYRRYRAMVLASHPPCALRLRGCTLYATTLDHDPPISEHAHRGFGCPLCRMLPACASCNLRSGGWRLANRRRRERQRAARAASSWPSSPQPRVW
jgi:hypothetical protein